MSNRFKNTLYTLGDYKRIGRHIRYITNEDGTLFSGHYRTKIRPEDLPEWSLYGRYYKRFGYMSTPRALPTCCTFPAGSAITI